MSNSKVLQEKQNTANVSKPITRRVAFTAGTKLTQRIVAAERAKGLRDSEISKLAIEEYLTKNGF